MAEIIIVNNDPVQITIVPDTPPVITVDVSDILTITINEGVAGSDAYEVAVQEGFVGTRAEWLASLTQDLSELTLEDKILKAQRDCDEIAKGFTNFYTSLGFWPISTQHSATETWTAMSTSGDVLPPSLDPGVVGWDFSNVAPLGITDYLSADDDGTWSGVWNGPYMDVVYTDPWGNPYWVNVDSFLTGGSVQVISAGPDYVLQTPASSVSATGDDIASLVKVVRPKTFETIDVTDNIIVSGNIGVGVSSPESVIHAIAVLSAATGNEVAYQLNYTTNKTISGNDTGLLINQTDTVSPGISNLIDAQVGNVSKFSVDNLGNIAGRQITITGDTYYIGNSTTFYSWLASHLSGNAFSFAHQGPKSNDSGQYNLVSITPNYNQTSGTASNTDLLINRTETAVGSGAQKLIDAQVGNVSKFNVSNTGKGYFANDVGIGTSTPSAKLSVSEKCAMNADGGFMVKLTNKTGGASVKGEVVTVYNDTAIDNAVKKTLVNVPTAIGVFYESDVADGSEAWIVISGIAEVYFGDSATRGHLARTTITGDAFTTAGYAISESAPTSPFATDKHFCEIGHVLASRAGAGLTKVLLHFN